MLKILTPENTIRKTPDEEGFRYLNYESYHGQGSWVVYEQGEEIVWVAKGIRKLKILDEWFGGELGPAEFADLPIVFNDFIQLPQFEEKDDTI